MNKKIIKEALIREFYNEGHTNTLNSAIDYACSCLDIKRPEIEFISSPEYTKHNKSFAAYSPSEKKVYVVTHNRNTADIMRSIAHELMHLRQDLDGRLTAEAGGDGDVFENEANSFSGKIMREIGREFPGIFESVNYGNLLGEDFDTNEEMKNLADDTYRVIIKRIVKRMLNTRPIPTSIPTYFMLVFNDLTGKYTKLKEFTDNFLMTVSLKPDAKSSNFTAFDEESGTINLSINSTMLTDAIRKYIYDVYKDTDPAEVSDEDIAETIKDVYFGTYHSKTLSTFEHELQHAYDAYRSKLKYTSDSNSKQYYATKRKDTENGLTPEEYKKYMKLHHEINARFTQAISDSHLIQHNFGDIKDKPRGYLYTEDLAAFLTRFKTLLRGYNMLNEKQQKYVMRRASQYWHRANEKIKEHNVRKFN